MRSTLKHFAWLLIALAGCRRDPTGQAPSPSGRSWATPPPENVDGGLAARTFPRVAYRGGPFLRNPRIATVTFKNDDPKLVTRLEEFGDKITRTAWWRAVVDSYCTRTDDCIGEGQPGAHLRLDDVLPAEIDANDLGGILEREVEAGRLGSLDGDTLVVIYPPKAVGMHDAFIAKYCTGGARAVHRALRRGKRIVPYAIVPRCGDEAQLTGSASHEILEATTNPDPAVRGFSFERSSSTLGFTAAGVEPVDPCGLIHRQEHLTNESGFVVQRAWSNRAAARGQDPCVPALVAGPYRALVPRQPTVRLAEEGASATIEVDATSDRPVPAWTISAFDLSGSLEQERYLDASLDRTTIASGESAKLTIKVLKRSSREVAIVGLESTDAGRSHVWPLAVVMR